MTCMSYLTTGIPGKEHRTYKQPPTRRISQRSEGERGGQSICPTNPRILLVGIHLDWAMHKPPRSTLSQNDWPETTWKLTPTTMKPKTESQVAEQFPWVSLPCCSLPRHPFPWKSLASSARVPPWTVYSSARHEPTLGLCKVSSFQQQLFWVLITYTYLYYIYTALFFNRWCALYESYLFLF